MVSEIRSENGLKRKIDEIKNQNEKSKLKIVKKIRRTKSIDIKGIMYLIIIYYLNQNYQQRNV